MKIKNQVGKLAAVTAIAFLGFVTSCSKNDETIGAQDAADASSESVSDAYYEDAGDVSLSYIQNDSPAKGGRVATDDRLTGVDITVDGDSISGVVTINFGTGKTDPRGNVRKGIIHLTYSNGPVGKIGFQVVQTFEEYYINDIKLEGARTFTREEAAAGNIKHHIVLTDGKATWPDATFATRTGDHHRELNPTDGTVTLTGTANGVNRKGKDYSVEITSPLIHKVSCATGQGIYMPVQGTEVITSNGKSITIDFGSGDCDRTVTVSIGKLSKEITLGTN